ncbi:hypothetical protein [Geitlerinema sp. PCC 9228]|jgi:hypothetical protein|uniref:hypothetical protein n=1 Tax=Geitlerinema sp. PCC 9228 TaxID=111611 RepID=UPI0008F9980F|nr:hypothetical protein [Geitlerinema sp. PCC 9228]
MVRAVNQQRTHKVVDLRENILVTTSLPNASIPALRSGFAGYPANPRWNAIKFHAWKLGRQWRREWQQGNLVVRASDSMLVTPAEDDAPESEPEPTEFEILATPTAFAM